MVKIRVYWVYDSEHMKQFDCAAQIHTSAQYISDTSNGKYYYVPEDELRQFKYLAFRNNCKTSLH